ncbi:hypothetical protein TNCV_2783031 [Trichonephila clavipes]|nr:hypothetical protein TNCV_2783031 [Trichonephila clavipes]
MDEILENVIGDCTNNCRTLREFVQLTSELSWPIGLSLGSVDCSFTDLGQPECNDWRRVIFIDESRFSLIAYG